MGLQIRIEDERPVPSRKVAPPTDFSSRSVKLRLMMLFAMLLAVIVLMEEAGKPERWQWMGFKEPAVGENSNADLFSQTPDPKSGNVTPERNEGSEFVPTEDASSNLANDYPIVAQEFWSKTVRRLSSDQQRVLFRLLRQLRRSETVSSGVTKEYKELIKVLRRRRAAFDTEKFDQLSMMSDGSVEKTELANALFEAREEWEEIILPAFESALQDHDITMGQLRQLEKLQHLLDPLVYAEVQDQTAIGWQGDSPAWVRLCEIVSQEQTPEDPIAVTHLQLSSQPGYYRGRWVTVEGWVRSARRKPIDQSELGLNHYHILWVRPADTKLSPYCIYTMKLPDNFPELTEQFQDLNERIRVTGLFFKIRSFVDAALEVSESPVIIADSLGVVPEFVPTSVSNWQPSQVALTTFFALIPVLAITIAWLVYRSSRSQPYHPGTTRTKQIHHALADLTHDSSVQSDREKIQELYQTDVDEA